MSSIVKWVYQDNFKLIVIIIIIRKDFSCAQKHSQANMNQQNKINETLNNKGNTFLRSQKLLRGWKLFALRFVLFVRWKPFRKKSKAWVVLITSFYYTTHYGCIWKITLKILLRHIMNFQVKHGQFDSIIFPQNIFFWRL